jgi:hypothetical protein
MRVHVFDKEGTESLGFSPSFQNIIDYAEEFIIVLVEKNGGWFIFHDLGEKLQWVMCSIVFSHCSQTIAMYPFPTLEIHFLFFVHEFLEGTCSPLRGARSINWQILQISCLAIQSQPQSQS